MCVCVCVRVCVSMQNFKSKQLLLIDIPCTVLCSDSPIVTTSTCTLILLPLVIDDFLVAHFNILELPDQSFANLLNDEAGD